MHHLKQVGWRETLKTLHPSDDGTHSSVSCVCSDILRQEDDLFRELLVKGLALPMREMRTGKRGKRGWKMVMQFPLGRIHTSLFCVIYVYCFMILNQKVCMDWTCRYQIAEFLCHFQVKLTLVTSKIHHLSRRVSWVSNQIVVCHIRLVLCQFQYMCHHVNLESSQVKFATINSKLHWVFKLIYSHIKFKHNPKWCNLAFGKWTLEINML